MSDLQEERKKHRQLSKLLARYRRYDELDVKDMRECDHCRKVVPIDSVMTVTRNRRPMVVACDQCMKKGAIVIKHLENPSRYRVAFEAKSNIQVASLADLEKFSKG